MAFTDSISDATICNWFYVFAWVNGLVAAFLVLVFAYVLMSNTGGKNPLASSLFVTRAVSTVIGVIIATTNYLFLSLMCERGLMPQGGRQRSGGEY